MPQEVVREHEGVEGFEEIVEANHQMKGSRLERFRDKGVEREAYNDVAV